MLLWASSAQDTERGTSINQRVCLARARSCELRDHTDLDGCGRLDRIRRDSDDGGSVSIVGITQLQLDPDIAPTLGSEDFHNRALDLVEPPGNTNTLTDLWAVHDVPQGSRFGYAATT